MNNGDDREIDKWDDDYWDDTKYFGDRAKFLMKVGGDVFRNGATLVFVCCECNKIRTYTPKFFNQVMGMVSFGGAKRHEQAVDRELMVLRSLRELSGVCICEDSQTG